MVYKGKTYDEHTSFSDWADLYVLSRKGDVSWQYEQEIKYSLSHAKKYIGNKPINDIYAFFINPLLLDLCKFNPNTKKPTGKKTLKKIRDTTRAVFEMARENGINIQNPAKKAKVPRKATISERRALTDEELNFLLTTDYKKMIVPLYIFVFGGLRSGELIPLTWSDISFKNSSIEVNKSVEKVSNNKYHIKKGTKNGKNRTIYLPRWVTIKLFDNRDVCSPLVTANANSDLHTPTSWRKLWSSFMKHENLRYYNLNNEDNRSPFNPAGIPATLDRITPHMLRHTYATLLYSSGVDILSAAKLLGHSNPDTTLTIYTHLRENTEKASIQKLESYSSRYFDLQKTEI